jgi:hypothetical protein
MGAWMKVFLSHQKNDSDLATRIAVRLRSLHNIDSYLDVIDPYVGGSINLLADHIRTEMDKCTQLLAVISPATAQSQWVPWEVGVATEKDFPLATFSGGQALPPEFLRKWPYLRTDSDLDEYAKASKAARDSFQIRRGYLTETAALQQSTRDFHKSLKATLRQS